MTQGDTASTPTVKYRKSKKPWVILIACCIVDMIGFTMPAMSFSVFLTPLRQGLGLTMMQAQMYNTAMMIATIVSTMFGDKILRIGAGKVIAISSALVIAGFCLLAGNPSVTTITIAGAIAGLAYPLLSLYTLPVVLSNWFYKNQGTWISICLACSGIGGFIMSPTITAMIAASGWQAAMTQASLIMVVPLLLGMFLIRVSPLPQGILPQGATIEELESTGKDATEAADLPGASYKQVRKTPAFVMLAIIMFCVGIISSYATNLNPLVQSCGYGAVVAGIALSASSVGNLIGKPIYGIIRDRKGAFFAGFCGYALMIVGLCLYLVGMVVYSEPMMIFAALIGGLGGCAGIIMPPLWTKDAFGSKDFDHIYSIQMGIRSIGAAIVSPCVGLIFDASGSYVPIVLIWIIASVIIIPGGYFAIKGGHKFWCPEAKVVGKPIDVKAK